ncbi:MAG: glycoside hydrolase family 140 protein [Cytophagales bacterium]|nr:glycoside hydrolase family 140 protein [Cytophagales bacterium]
MSIYICTCNTKTQTNATTDNTCLSSLKVSPNGRYIQTRDGKPFFYMGDTSWELFHRLSREEIKQYLESRKQLMFNVVQAVAIGELDGLRAKNAYGDLPMRLDNIAIPDTTSGNDVNDTLSYDYWDHIEYGIKLAAKNDMYIALLPCWGEYVTPRFTDTIVFSDSIKGYNYGWFIGNRFKKYNNIIWILGGDRFPNEIAHGISTWNAMAEGINDGVCNIYEPNGKANYESTFMSYHCMYPASVWFASAPWLDVDMWGTYHEKRDNDRSFEVPYILANSKNIRPTINAEPPYEDAGINYDFNNGYFDDFDVRQHAYWSVLAGCVGHTYGNNALWQCINKNTYHKNRDPRHKQWYDALYAQGAQQMKYLRLLIEEINILEMVPNQKLIAYNIHDPTGHIQAASGTDFALYYIPTGKELNAQMGIIKGEKIFATWYDPKTGQKTQIGEYVNKGIVKFTPPGKPQRGNDWVLILKSL